MCAGGIDSLVASGRANDLKDQNSKLQKYWAPEIWLVILMMYKVDFKEN